MSVHIICTGLDNCSDTFTFSKQLNSVDKPCGLCHFKGIDMVMQISRYSTGQRDCSTYKRVNACSLCVVFVEGSNSV